MCGGNVAGYQPPIGRRLPSLVSISHEILQTGCAPCWCRTSGPWWPCVPARQRRYGGRQHQSDRACACRPASSGCGAAAQGIGEGGQVACRDRVIGVHQPGMKHGCRKACDQACHCRWFGDIGFRKCGDCKTQRGIRCEPVLMPPPFFALVRMTPYLWDGGACRGIPTMAHRTDRCVIESRGLRCAATHSPGWLPCPCC